MKANDYDLLIYVMNATQLFTNDDDLHVNFVKENCNVKKILFVVNKIDMIDLEVENSLEIMERVWRYLFDKNFSQPIICPLSALAGLLVKRNPYRFQTPIKVNGREIEADSSLQKYVSGKRLQEWIGLFPHELRNELNTMDFDVEFYGTELDWDDFEFAFRQAQEDNVVRNLSLTFIQGQSKENIAEEIKEIFLDLREGSVEDFRDPKLLKDFNRVHDAFFPVNVVATMSSSKSTLINAFLEQKLMPAKRRALQQSPA